MNEKTLKALVDAGAVKVVHILGEGASFHVKAQTSTGAIPATTLKGAVKTWRTLDAAAKWVRGLGVGVAQVDLSRWEPRQEGLKLQ